MVAQPGVKATVLQSWIDRLALHSQHTRHTLMHLTQWLIMHKALKCFDAKGKFTHGERTFRRYIANTQSAKILRNVVFRAIDDITPYLSGTAGGGTGADRLSVL